MVFGRDTLATFQRDLRVVTVVLDQGNVSLYHPPKSLDLRVKAGDVLIQSEPGFKTLSEVAMLNGAVVVTAKEGQVRVDRNGETTMIAKGKTLTIPLQTRNARAPQVGTSQHVGGGGKAMAATGLGLGGVAAVLGAVALSRARDAQDAATTASAATANAAAAANANSVGCALNVVANHQGLASPYTPTAAGCH